jgi:pSer/pThr/pTyr-binding forkhead associated (FHA) protein
MADSLGRTILNHALIVKDKNGPKAYWLTAPMYTLGRDPSNSIRIDSRFVSRQHALLIRVSNEDGGFAYQVLDGDTNGNPSTNGLFVNHKRIDFCDLSHGDEIQLSSDVTATYVQTEKTFEYILSTYEHTQLVQ